MGVCCGTDKSHGFNRTETLNSLKGGDKSGINAAMFVNKKHFSKLSREYQILEYLGKGAFGVVQKVKHIVSGDIRAMKIINKDSFLGSFDEEKLDKEVDILKKLDHPNILKIYEFYFDSKNYYIVTEFCKGGELFDKINELGTFSEKIAASIIKQILQGVSYCHSKGIVHRDLKPENILIESISGSGELSIKIIDFGASSTFKKREALTEKTGTVIII